MSWLDSSFGFAKTALSQAQKSIDRVLDIQETHEENESTVSGDGGYSIHADRPSSKDSSIKSGVEVQPSTDSFISTWGGMDSFWGDKTTPEPQQVSKDPTPKRKLKVRTAPLKTVTTTKAEMLPNVNSTPYPKKSDPSITTPPSTVHIPIDSPATLTTNMTSTPVSERASTITPQHDSVDGETLSNLSNIQSETTQQRTSLKHHDEMEKAPVKEKEEVEKEQTDKQGVNVKIEERELERNEEEQREQKEETHTERQRLNQKMEEKVEETRRVNVEEPVRTRERQGEQKGQGKKKEEEVPRERTEKEKIEIEQGKEEGQDEELNNGGPVETEFNLLDSAPVKGSGIPESPVNSMAAETLVESSKAEVVIDCEVSNKSEEKIRTLEMELKNCQELLRAREMKVLEQSEAILKLQQTNLEMQRCLDEFKKQVEKIDESKDELRRQTTTAEQKIQALTKERDSLKRQLQTERNQQKDSVEQRLTEMLKEKDEMIAGLMEEGEKLSKQELQSNNVIKKLRSREKENERTVASQKQQIEDFEGEVKRLKDVIKKKDDNEVKYQESLGHMNSMVEQLNKELNEIKPERDELQDRARSLQANLDSTYKELTELRKTNALSQSAAQEATASAQLVAKEELRKELDEQRLKGEREKDALVLQINEMRLSVSRTEQQASWREDQLRQEIAELHKRLQESDCRNQDLSDTISNATRPLLRQIEHLRSAQSAQSNNWEKVESSLTQRLVEAQTQLNAAGEKERSATEKLLTVQSRVGSLEEQVKSLRQERSQLVATLETEKTKLQTLEETHQRESLRHDTYRANVQQNIEELKKDKEMLERQLEYERVRLEAESRKADLELQEKEKLRNQLAMSLTSVSTPSTSRQSSSTTPIGQNDSLEQSGSTSDLGSLLRMGGTSFGSASVLENLQSLLKQKEGELSNTQGMVNSLERSRAAITEELTQVSASNEALKREVQIIPELKQQLQEVGKNYEALLQMYGEKVEEAEELKLDIQDLKTMYRQQIEELVTQQ